MSQPYDDPYRQQVAPKSNSNWVLPTCLLSCLGIFILLLIAGAVGGWWLYKKAPAFLAQAGGDAIISEVQSMDIPEAEKTKVVTQIRRLQDAVRDGQLGMSDMERVVARISNSPVLEIGAMMMVQQYYIEPSGLSDDEKVEAERTLQRVARGVIEESISMEQLEPAMNIIATKDANGNWKMKEKGSVDDESLREFLSQCKAVADNAGIPDENFQYSIGDEMEKLVDDILSPEQAPATE